MTANFRYFPVGMCAALMRVLNQPLTIAEHEAKTGEVSEGVVP